MEEEAGESGERSRTESEDGGNKQEPRTVPISFVGAVTSSGEIQHADEFKIKNVTESKSPKFILRPEGPVSTDGLVRSQLGC